MDTVEISDSTGKTRATINLKNSQLFSLRCHGREFMWGGGKLDDHKNIQERRGWQNSEIIMFPVIGALKDSRVKIGGRQYPMAQHGTCRYAGFTLSDLSDSKATFIQNYRACSTVGHGQNICSFPFGYSLKKTYTIESGELHFSVDVANLSEEPMPFAIGWHPAFLIHSPANPDQQFVRIGPSGKEIGIGAIKKKQSGEGSIVEPGSEAEYVFPHGKVLVSARDLGFMQLWSPEDQGQICLEPISAPPDRNYDGELFAKQGYRTLAANSSARFDFQITVSLPY
ncbi:MAG TPA: hypothetical protein VJP79_09800 [Nitrososphaera sp.]|nr:hypothetical protein [Nitrososphaera sp.]